jgi:hypothetical protein
MQQLPRAEGAPNQMPPRTKKCFYEKAGNEPAFDLKAEFFRISGVDMTDVPGTSTIRADTFLIEVGPEPSRFRNASAFLMLFTKERYNDSVLVTWDQQANIRAESRHEHRQQNLVSSSPLPPLNDRRRDVVHQEWASVLRGSPPGIWPLIPRHSGAPNFKPVL